MNFLVLPNEKIIPILSLKERCLVFGSLWSVVNTGLGDLEKKISAIWEILLALVENHSLWAIEDQSPVHFFPLS